MRGFFAMPLGLGGFFFISWVAMIFWGIIAPDLGLETLSYAKAMLVTIALWLVVAPLARAIARGQPR